MPISHSAGLLPPVSQPASIILNVQFVFIPPPAPRCLKRPLRFDTSQSREWKAHSASVQNMEDNTLLRLQSFKAKSVELQVILLFCQHATARQQSTEPLTACDVSGVVFLTRESEFLISAKFFTDKSPLPLPG